MARPASSSQIARGGERAGSGAAPVQVYETCPEEAASHPAEMTSHDNALGWTGRSDYNHKIGLSSIYPIRNFPPSQPGNPAPHATFPGHERLGSNHSHRQLRRRCDFAYAVGDLPDELQRTKHPPAARSRKGRCSAAPLIDPAPLEHRFAAGHWDRRARNIARQGVCEQHVGRSHLGRLPRPLPRNFGDGVPGLAGTPLATGPRPPSRAGTSGLQ